MNWTKHESCVSTHGLILQRHDSHLIVLNHERLTGSRLCDVNPGTVGSLQDGVKDVIISVGHDGVHPAEHLHTNMKAVNNTASSAYSKHTDQ